MATPVQGGAVFSIFLPAVLVRHRTDQSRAWAFQPKTGAGRRILFIEDEDTVRDYTQRALSRLGYQVFTVNTVASAKKTFLEEKGKFDLILSDILLPDGNGLHLIREFHQEKPELKVMLWSGQSDSRVGMPDIEKSEFPFLRKPFILTELLEKIEGILIRNVNDRPV